MLFRLHRYQHIAVLCQALSHQLAVIYSHVEQYTPSISTVFESFWEQPYHSTLLMVSDQHPYCILGDDYYVSQASLSANPYHQLQIRLSQSLCNALLESALGKTSHGQQASLTQMSEFETYLLKKFTIHLYKSLENKLYASHLSPHYKGRLIHLMWNIDLPSTPGSLSGMLLMTLPLQAIALKENPEVAEPYQVISYPLSKNLPCLVTLRAGQARTTVQDIQSLEAGDVIVLEKSQVGQLALVIPETQEEQWFQLKMSGAFETVEIESHLMEDPVIAQVQELDAMPNPLNLSGEKPLWKKLSVNLQAEFEPISLPLYQLEEISKGLVLEIAALSHNQIRLHVEGETVATGDLIIVGNHFGVRIREVYQNGSAVVTSSPEKPPAKDKPQNPTNQERDSDADHESAPEQASMVSQQDAAMAEDIDAFLNDDFDEDLMENQENY